MILDFHDSYTRNLLQLVSEQARHGWDATDWQRRAVVINVDSLSWFVPNNATTNSADS